MPKWMNEDSIQRWLTDGQRIVAPKYRHGVNQDEAWWPLLGRSGQGEATSWCWAAILLAAQEVPMLHARPLQFAANLGRERHRQVRNSLLRQLWSGSSRTHSKFEILVDYTINSYDNVGRPIVMSAESEVASGHGVGPGMGLVDDATGMTDDYTWDFYKLLLVTSPRRLFIARVGGVAKDGSDEADRIKRLAKSLDEVMQWYGAELLGDDDELAAVILPERPTSGWAGVCIGVWTDGVFSWSKGMPPR